MSKEKIVKVDYFNINENKNSILENAPFQDNEINQHLNDIESLTKEIKNEVLKSEKQNQNKMIDFTKIKKNNQSKQN